jgi:DNA polymerase-3 subunit delta'
MEAGNHPDLLLVSRPEDKNVLPLDLFIGPDERRHREGLCHDIARKPMLGGRRVAVIDDADLLTPESANSLLKTLEEPPPRSVLILIGTSQSKQLPTIRSRSQVVRFQPLSAPDMEHLLTQTGLAENSDAAVRLAELSGGSLAQAAELNDPELWRFREQLLGWLDAEPVDAVRLMHELSAFVDSAGTEAVARRGRLKSVLQFAADFFRARMRELADANKTHLSPTEQADHGLHDLHVCVRQLDRCLEAIDQTDRYANQATLIHAWSVDAADYAASS